MNYISVRQIMDDLLADDMMRGLSLERAVNYAVEFIRIVGMPAAFEEKIATIDIKEHRGILPCDLFKIIQVRQPCGPSYIYASTTFNPRDGLVYKVQGNVIITSTKEGKVEISYTAMGVDGEGFPLIVDNGTFARALELYIQKRWFTILFNSGKLAAPILQNVKQEYAFYVGQAQNDLIKPSLDQMESIKNMWTTLIQKDHKHSDVFSSMNAPEIRRF